LIVSIETGPVVHVPSSGLTLASADAEATGVVGADGEAAGTTVGLVGGAADGVAAGEQPATTIARISNRDEIRIGSLSLGP
jgi:hypothetical protein